MKSFWIVIIVALTVSSTVVGCGVKGPLRHPQSVEQGK